MSTTRIYVITQKDKPARLVEATSANTAIRHCARPEFVARTATPKDVAAMLAKGTSVETATEPTKQTN